MNIRDMFGPAGSQLISLPRLVAGSDVNVSKSAAITQMFM